MNNKNNRLLMAAVAGIALGASTPATLHAEDAVPVKCYGINGCGSHAKCSVAIDDLEAVRTLLGDQQYNERFGKSKAHSCGPHAKCGSESLLYFLREMK